MRRHTKIHIGSSQNFYVNQLTIDPTLAGRSHHFKFEGWPIEVCLPEAPPSGQIGNVIGDEKIWCSHWRSSDRFPLTFEVGALAVFVNLERTEKVPSGVIGRPSSSLLTPRQQKTFQRLADQSERIAVGAFDLWARTLRWKSDGFQSVRPRITPGPITSAYLTDHGTKRRFFSGPITVTATHGTPLTLATWRAIQKALRDSHAPPIWFDFLSEGQYRIHSGDLPGGIIDLAIATEALLRKVLSIRYTRAAGSDEFTAIMNQIPIGRILDRWNQLGFKSGRWKSSTDLKSLKRLFELRNKLMHRGLDEFSDAECSQLGKAVRDFVIYTDRHAKG